MFQPYEFPVMLFLSVVTYLLFMKLSKRFLYLLSGKHKLIASTLVFVGINSIILVALVVISVAAEIILGGTQLGLEIVKGVLEERARCLESMESQGLPTNGCY